MQKSKQDYKIQIHVNDKNPVKYSEQIIRF